MTIRPRWKWIASSIAVAILVGVVIYTGWTVSGNEAANRQMQAVQVKAVEWGLNAPDGKFKPKGATGKSLFLVYKKQATVLIPMRKIMAEKQQNAGTKIVGGPPASISSGVPIGPYSQRINNLSPAQFAKLQAIMAPSVIAIRKASKVPVQSPSIASSRSAESAIDFPSLASSKAVAKVLEYDAFVQLRKNDPLAFGKDVTAIMRIANQNDQGNTMINYLVGAAIGSIGLVPITEAIRKHPTEKAWLISVRNALETYQEPALFASAPEEWSQLQSSLTSLRKASPTQVKNALKAVSGNDENQSPDVNLSIGPNRNRFIADCAAYQITVMDGERYQFCSPGQWTKQSKKAEFALKQHGKIYRLSTILVFDSALDVKETLKMRLLMNMMSTFVNASLYRLQYKTWPASLKFGSHVNFQGFVPSSQPIQNVLQAKPRSTLSSTDPFTGRYIQYLKSGNGITLVGTAPKSVLNQVTSPRRYFPAGKTGYFIHIQGNSVTTNIFP